VDEHRVSPTDNFNSGFRPGFIFNLYRRRASNFRSQIYFARTVSIVIVIIYTFRMCWLKGLENSCPGGGTIRIHVTNELYIRFRKHGAVFDKMVFERSRILSIRAEGISSDSSIPNAWHNSRREYY